MNEILHGIAELPTYIRLVNKLLSVEERQDLIGYLAEHPKAGDIMEGTGGVRKLRWRRGGQGKSGGVRIIYYYHDDLMPLYLLTLFAKGDKANLTKAERNELAGLVDVLVNLWKGREKS
ncbi:type II toxin-antitoxin system RelE/ParE family toxin [Castellaniella defragrans]|uniref:RelE-like Cytotoxic translational repressor of toxin-antitoxin stability system n=1 Tax=Castellaniella defragrans (strain DSM 12143 / CCUG 39792 / 65Phen) TaxID=1437824 RepID=W8X1A6_CASD6|nr:type II toxin-antitoxin system RelE/ParE family toxin [Castellaniella defragrans]CDM25694.1 RelE-like Cytotoxic translational repressor of toxin-antitoxin stability system [Castellaniella defragrans 65Phen]